MPETKLQRYQRLARECHTLLCQLTTNIGSIRVEPDCALPNPRVMLRLSNGCAHYIEASQARGLAKAILRIVGEEDESDA